MSRRQEQKPDDEDYAWGKAAEHLDANNVPSPTLPAEAGHETDDSKRDRQQQVRDDAGR
jgi:hypothetical protein